jgi:Mn2+/Fe2+ NRAMP family transporter
VNSPRSRKGTAADRGRVIRWPVEQEEAPPPETPSALTRWFARLGPGIVTGVADVDPSLVVTATVAGTTFGYGLLWVVVLSLPFLIATFSATGRIGHETRKGLVDLLREHHGRGWAIACAAVIVFINMAMIIADLMAVSDALGIILVHQRIVFIAVTAFSVWYVLIFHDYRKITRVLLWLALPLFLYVAAAVLSVRSWVELGLGTVVPRVVPSVDYVSTLVGLFGSLLTPYILVWQTSSRGEHANTGGDPHEDGSHAGSFVTTILCFSVIVAAGSVLHLPNPTAMTTRQAAEALRPVAGDLGAFVFALGIIGAGLVALPVLVASMCYSIAEAMEWKAGLSEHPWEAKRFYVLISAGMLIAATANFLPINPVRALFWSQILAGMLTVPILLFIVWLANDRRVMQTVNTRWQNFWIGAAAGGLVAAQLLWAWWALHT